MENKVETMCKYHGSQSHLIGWQVWYWGTSSICLEIISRRIGNYMPIIKVDIRANLESRWASIMDVQGG
jgi:hypothetical protein